MDVRTLTGRIDRSTAAWGPSVLRATAAMLWLANVNWKVPPAFGRTGERCVALCRFVEAGAENPVVPGSAWFFEHVASPNLALFGWITLLTESVLVALLVSGRFVRIAAVEVIAKVTDDAESQLAMLKATVVAPVAVAQEGAHPRHDLAFLHAVRRAGQHLEQPAAVGVHPLRALADDRGPALAREVGEVGAGEALAGLEDHGGLDGVL